MALVSCKKSIVEQDVLITGASIEDQKSHYAVSKEDALNRLNDFMDAFDGAETRSQHRRVVSIKGVSAENICGQTRGSQTNEIGDLLYIVEFENGMGSAILGADERLESVYAVLDESVLTVDDFNNALNGDNLDDISTFAARLIVNDVNNSIFDRNDSLELTPPGGGFNTHWYDYVTVVTRTKYIEPLLNTKWDQTSYYNDRFPNTETGAEFGDGKQCAGCTTIALAQILNNNSYPSPIEVNNHTYYWRDLNRHTWNAEPSDIESVDTNLMASFIFDLAEDLRVEYDSNGSTSAGVNDVKRVMRRLGYSNFSEGGITEGRIYPMLLNGRAVWTEGYGTNCGHAWVIDGWKTLRSNYYCITYNADNVEISRELQLSVTESYVHCNMGWGARCDGYYTTTIFDTTRAHIGDYIEIEYGDKANTTNEYVYNQGFNTLIYSF